MSRSKPNGMWTKAASPEPRERPDYSHIQPALGDLGMVKFAGKAARQKAVIDMRDGEHFRWLGPDGTRRKWLTTGESQTAIAKRQEASQ